MKRVFIILLLMTTHQLVCMQPQSMINIIDKRILQSAQNELTRNLAQVKDDEMKLKITAQLNAQYQRDRNQIIGLLNSADVNATDAEGKTRLHWVVRLRDIPALEQLIKLKANLNATDSLGFTPLHLATELFSDETSQSIIEKLINAGADPALQNNNKQTATQIMVNKYILAQNESGIQALISLIWPQAKQTTNLNLQDARGNTLLYALVAGLKETRVTDTIYTLIKTMLEKGANPNLQNKDGYTPLHAAVIQQNPVIVTLLLKLGANTEIRSFVPRTAKEIKDQMPPKPDKTPLELAQALKAGIPAAEQENIANIEQAFKEAAQLKGEPVAQEPPLKQHKGENA